MKSIREQIENDPLMLGLSDAGQAAMLMITQECANRRIAGLPKPSGEEMSALVVSRFGSLVDDELRVACERRRAL